MFTIDNALHVALTFVISISVVWVSSCSVDVWLADLNADDDLEWFYKHNGNTNRDPELTLRINPSRKGYLEFIRAHKDDFLLSVN